MERRSFFAALGAVMGAGLLTTKAMAGKPVAASPGSAMDHIEVANVLLTERWARDMAQWDEMRAMYHPDATVSISWFKGTGEEFINGSIAASKHGARAQSHFLKCTKQADREFCRNNKPLLG